MVSRFFLLADKTKKLYLNYKLAPANQMFLGGTLWKNLKS